MIEVLLNKPTWRKGCEQISNSITESKLVKGVLCIY